MPNAAEEKTTHFPKPRALVISSTTMGDMRHDKKHVTVVGYFPYSSTSLGVTAFFLIRSSPAAIGKLNRRGPALPGFT